MQVVRTGAELIVGGAIRAEVAGIQKRRRTDAHMNFESAGLFQTTDEPGNGGSSYDGIIDKNDVLPFYCVLQDVKLKADTIFPFFLGRVYLSTSPIAVFVGGEPDGNAGSFCKDKRIG